MSETADFFEALFSGELQQSIPTNNVIVLQPAHNSKKQRRRSSSAPESVRFDDDLKQENNSNEYEPMNREQVQQIKEAFQPHSKLSEKFNDSNHDQLLPASTAFRDTVANGDAPTIPHLSKLEVFDPTIHLHFDKFVHFSMKNIAKYGNPMTRIYCPKDRNHFINRSSLADVKHLLFADLPNMFESALEQDQIFVSDTFRYMGNRILDGAPDLSKFERQLLNANLGSNNPIKFPAKTNCSPNAYKLSGLNRKGNLAIIDYQYAGVYPGNIRENKNAKPSRIIRNFQYRHWYNNDKTVLRQIGKPSINVAPAPSGSPVYNEDNYGIQLALSMAAFELRYTKMRSDYQDFFTEMLLVKHIYRYILALTANVRILLIAI